MSNPLVDWLFVNGAAIYVIEEPLSKLVSYSIICRHAAHSGTIANAIMRQRVESWDYPRKKSTNKLAVREFFPTSHLRIRRMSLVKAKSVTFYRVFVKASVFRASVSSSFVKAK